MRTYAWIAAVLIIGSSAVEAFAQSATTPPPPPPIPVPTGVSLIVTGMAVIGYSAWMQRKK